MDNFLDNKGLEILANLMAKKVCEMFATKDYVDNAIQTAINDRMNTAINIRIGSSNGDTLLADDIYKNFVNIPAGAWGLVRVNNMSDHRVGTYLKYDSNNGYVHIMGPRGSQLTWSIINGKYQILP